MVGILHELVPKPIPKVMAASTPKKSATTRSSSRCTACVPEKYKTYDDISGIYVQRRKSYDKYQEFEKRNRIDSSRCTV